MIKDQIRLSKGRGTLTLALLLALALVVSACGGAAPALSGVVSTAVGVEASSPAANSGTNTTSVPQTQIPNTGIDCTATYKANLDFGLALA